MIRKLPEHDNMTDEEYFAEEIDAERYPRLEKPYDIILLICSRGRPKELAEVTESLAKYFTPTINSLELSYCIVVYGQEYGSDFMQEFDDERQYPFMFVPFNNEKHSGIGSVVKTAVVEADKCLEKRTGHSLLKSKMVMLIDDDSYYAADTLVNINIKKAIRKFIDGNFMLYSIRTGTGRTLDFLPLVDDSWPVMSGKEKMLWVRPDMLLRAVNTPRFADLTLCEDVAISTVCWQEDYKLCAAVYGIGTFTHLGADLKQAPSGGLELLPEPHLHVTPCTLFPDLFVPTWHALYWNNGLRPEVIANIGTSGVKGFKFDLG